MQGEMWPTSGFIPAGPIEQKFGSERPVLSAVVGRNAELIFDVVRLYAPPGSVIADVTYGKGNFWKAVDTSQFDFRPTDLMTGTDCRSLPYANGSIDVVAFDPPYIYNPKATVKASISGSYNVNTTDGLPNIAAVEALYDAGIAEAHRVLRKGGTLWVKCQDQIQSNKQHWLHMTIALRACETLDFYQRDLFVLVQSTQPTIRWPHQHHARKNHSYLWILEKR